MFRFSARLLAVPLAAAALLAPAAAGAAGNPLAGQRQFIPCEFLTNPNQGWAPWYRAHRASGNTRALLEKIAEVPTVYSFAGTPADKIGRRMERYMTELDHPPLGGSSCATPFSYSSSEWNAGRPLPAGAPERKYIGNYPILAIRSLDYSSFKKGSDPATPYRKFIDAFTKQLGLTYKSRTPYAYRDSAPAPGTHWISYRQRQAAIILEPDFLALWGTHVSCKRGGPGVANIRYAVGKLGSLPNVTVYIDAGENNWLPVGCAVRLLKKAGVGQARGFVLNATHTGRTSDNIAYGNKIAKRLGGKHYVINTAENAHGKSGDGNNSNCNPKNAGMGTQPTTHTASKYADAYLYISRIGISSNAGNRCGRGPTANVWWQFHALEVARQALFHAAYWPPKPL